MWLRAGCGITFDVSIDTPFILMFRARSGLHQLVAAPGEFSKRTSADILTADSVNVCPGAPFEDVRSLPGAVLTYLLPSRYCGSDRFIDIAQEIVAGVAPGYDQVAAIEAWISENINFNPASTYFQLSAVEVNQQREGVCRDLAHLGIALCRGLCIRARMVVGYLHKLVPMDFHAWFEAYVGGRWYPFGATQSHPRGGRITVAYGRDAADMAIFSQFGPALHPREMCVHVDLLDSAPE